MDAVQARSLINQIAPGSRSHLPGSVAMDAGVRALVSGPLASRAVAPRTASVIQAFEQDKIAWDPALHKLIRTESALTVDESVRPHDQSDVFEKSVEQCMEFVERYFRTEMTKAGRDHGSFGEDWPTQHNIAPEVRAMAKGTKQVDGYSAYLNGQGLPPRAGDVLSLETAEEQKDVRKEFHVALVSKVFQRNGQWFVRVYEANVPLNKNDADLKKHYEDIPMTVKDGKWTLSRVMTSQRGYQTDMDVAGWIHPTGKKALPGAMADTRPSYQPLSGRLFGVA